MTSASNPPQQPRRAGQGTANRWALRVLVAFVVLAVLVPLVSFVYPWLVASGVL